MPTSAARKGGRVVDAVAHESDDVALAPEDADDAFFVSGREPGKQRRPIGCFGQFGVGHFLDVATQEHRVRGEANVLAYLAADREVISSEDFHSHAMFVQGRKGAGRGLLGWVEESHVPSEYEVALVFPDANLRPGQLLGGYRQHAEAVVAEIVVLLLQVHHLIRVHWGQLAVEFKMRALEKHLFGSPFGKEDRFAFGVFD